MLGEHPSVHLIEMGTRRRFPGAVEAHEWQERALSRGLATIPDQILGTSNAYLAKLFGIPVKGTMAHQGPMILAAKKMAAGDSVNPLVDAQNLWFDLWEDAYGHVNNGAMLIALPDTFGTGLTLSHFGAERARRWAGFRQDSGDPFVQTNRMIQFYLQNEIAPEGKLIVPSDALKINTMLSLEHHLGSRVLHPYGWGGNWMNDCGYDTPSIVAKPIWVDGEECIKLGDDLSKSNGNSDTVNRYKEIAKWGRL